MPTYKAPVDDALFLLNDVFHIDRYGNLPGFSDASPDVVEAILREAAKFSEEVLTPLNRVGDKEGCKRASDGSVTTPTGFKEAYKQIIDGGWIGISVPAEYGGQGLPATMTVMVNEFLCSANMAFAMYPGLTQGAIAALLVHASDALKKKFVPKMVEGVWTGTMNLTEPHCGTDLGLLRAKAAKQADGSYRITGTKIFISAGEHDLSQNIIHLVLARIEGAPAGTKGISLFVVPKFLIKDDGSLGARNAVVCGSIEEKMGIHGNSTCVMNYDGATGWLIGEENRGLNAMFTMMNEARLGVGVQGLALPEVAYQNAAIYTRERLQGRAISGVKYPDKPADPIIVHPDVRRTLMSIRAFNAGKHEMDDVLRKIVFACGDEDLGAGDLVAAVPLLHRFRAQQAKIGAAMRLGEIHRAGPDTFHHLRHVFFLQRVRSVHQQRSDGALRKARVHRESHVRRAQKLVDHDGHRGRKSLPAVFGRH
jgi:alkylation response protein AidB-like acyl-CoA dehydrogenase